MVEDSDGHQASMSYDATGRLASVVAPNGETISFVYDAGGRLVEQRLNSGQRTTQSWFEDGGLKQRQNLFNTTILSSHLYTLDNQGRRSGQTEVIGGATKTWSYLYDNLDRLTSASDASRGTPSTRCGSSRIGLTSPGPPCSGHRRRPSGSRPAIPQPMSSPTGARSKPGTVSAAMRPWGSSSTGRW